MCVNLSNLEHLIDSGDLGNVTDINPEKYEDLTGIIYEISFRGLIFQLRLSELRARKYKGVKIKFFFFDLGLKSCLLYASLVTKKSVTAYHHGGPRPFHLANVGLKQ